LEILSDQLCLFNEVDMITHFERVMNYFYSSRCRSHTPKKINPDPKPISSRGIRAGKGWTLPVSGKKATATGVVWGNEAADVAAGGGGWGASPSSSSSSLSSSLGGLFSRGVSGTGVAGGAGVLAGGAGVLAGGAGVLAGGAGVSAGGAGVSPGTGVGGIDCNWGFCSGVAQLASWPRAKNIPKARTVAPNQIRKLLTGFTENMMSKRFFLLKMYYNPPLSINFTHLTITVNSTPKEASEAKSMLEL
jgi:hypothetical protein